jgi:hypothetical protein
MLLSVPFQRTIFPLSLCCAVKVDTGSVISGLKEAGVFRFEKLVAAFVLNAVLVEKTGAGMAIELTVRPDKDARLVPLNGLTNSGRSALLVCKF